MTAYYNEIDPFAAKWLRNLIDANLIAHGVVDTRSIEDVTPNDLKGFTQCHFFAGIGGWSYALRLAGWPDNKPIWTGSCPCQPFSTAGKGDGFADERHLWPAFFHLISQCKPQFIFGEQVAGSHSNAWFDLVQSDLEGMDYAFGLVPFTSASIGAPHIRERAYWLAHADMQCEPTARDQKRSTKHFWCSEVDWLADSNCRRFIGRATTTQQEERDSAGTSGGLSAIGPLEVNGFWRDADWLFCRDGKWRPVEPGTFPLVNGFPKGMGHGKSSPRALAGRNRLGRLKGYGNAINIYAAAAFIDAVMDSAL